MATTASMIIQPHSSQKAWRTRRLRAASKSFMVIFVIGERLHHVPDQIDQSFMAAVALAAIVIW